jgi:hypothetical protein
MSKITRTADARERCPCWFVWILCTTILEGASLSPEVPKFVGRYCLECHNDKREKGDRSFQHWLKQPGAPGQHGLLEEMLDQLNLGEMPPHKKGIKHPAHAERRRVIAEITRYLTVLEQAAEPTSTGMRRLTRYEYQYTLRDLLGIDTSGADMTRLFPTETRTDGFANLRTNPTLTEYQLECYMEAARRYLDMALVFGRKQPEPRTWVFNPRDLNGEKKNSGSVRYRVWGEHFTHLDIAHGQPIESGPTYPKTFSKQGVPFNGKYRIRIRATAVGRQHPYDPEIFPNDLDLPLQLGLWHVPEAGLLGKRASEGRTLIGVYDLPDEEPSDIETIVWMPAGSTPFVHWINGPGASKAILRKVAERYHPEAIRKSRSKVDRLREQGLPIAEDALVQKVHISDVYQGPRIRLFQITMEGPLFPEWPPPGHRKIIGPETDPEEVDIQETLLAFASKAFRRPVSKQEVLHYIRFVQQQLEMDVPRSEALRQGLTAILSSPGFLYLGKDFAEDGKALDAFELSSRLSYALWCSMPDEHLTGLAASGELLQTNTFASEVDRLLNDPRSMAFVEHFTDAWLQLYKIGTMPPGQKQFPAYYRDRLESAMKQETRLFIADAMHHNHPIQHLLDSRQTFLNGNLARHYGLTNVVGPEFRKTTFPDAVSRAGLLGHASVLTASANGVETSPVVRGVWLLNNILGTPPAEPPPDVSSIEPDTRGAITIREQLVKHRAIATCADCHAKIDPWGFALEFYDPIGSFRAHYPLLTPSGRIANRPGKPVDGSGRLPDGGFLRDDSDLRRELIKRKDQLTLNLIRKFLTYATGRQLTFRDQAEVKRIRQKLSGSGEGFRDLIKFSLQSNIFKPEE